MICIIIFSKSTYLAAKEGFMLWVNNIVPSLLPFLICIDLLKHTNFLYIIGKMLTPIMRPLFNVPGCGAFAIALGITSGYPVGAKICTELYENDECTKSEAERLLAFTNTSGPLFIVSSVGTSMFHNSQIGILLLLTHFIASLIVGILFRKYNFKSSSNPSDIITHKETKINKNNKLCISNLGLFMGNAIQNAISTLLLICGYIIFFAVLGNILENLGAFKSLSSVIIPFFNLLNIPIEYANCILKGILEVTNGIKNISEISLSYSIFTICVVAFLLGFGGLSVFMQVSSIVSKCNLSMKTYFWGKLLHGLIASTITFIILKYTNLVNLAISVPAFNYLNKQTIIINETTNLISVICSITLLAILIKFLSLLKKCTFNKRRKNSV